MMKEFARRLKKKHKKVYHGGEDHIRYALPDLSPTKMAYSICLRSCLAHVINLATQALIKHRSPAAYYDSNTPDAHVPSLDPTPELGFRRDELALVRAIFVKVRIMYWPSCLSNFKSVL